MKVGRFSREGTWRVFAACTDRGDCPLETFLCGLGPGLQSSVNGMIALLDHVALHGPPRNVELSHQLRGDIYEFIKGRIRVLYFCDRGRVVVCTHGFVKKTGKVRNSEIDRAEAVMLAYRNAIATGRLEILDPTDP